MRAGWQKGTLPFLLLGGGSGLGGLSFGHPLLEFVYASGCVDELLLAGVKGVTGIADTDNNHRFSGASLDDVAASATEFRIHLCRMYILFHKRLEKITPVDRMTSPIFINSGAPECRLTNREWTRMDAKTA